jgi:hypothetical protein
MVRSTTKRELGRILRPEVKRAVAIVLLAALVAGCGQPYQKFVGTWKGTAVSPRAALQNLRPQFESDEAFELYITAYADGPLTLELKADGTYTVEGIFLDGKKGKFHGKWTSNDEAHTLTLSPRIIEEHEEPALIAQGYTEEQIHLWKDHYPAKTFVVELDNKKMSWTEVWRVDTISETFTKED